MGFIPYWLLMGLIAAGTALHDRRND